MEQRDLKKGLCNYFIINEAIHPVGLYIINEFVFANISELVPDAEQYSGQHFKASTKEGRYHWATVLQSCLSVCCEASMNGCMILGGFS